MLNFQTFNNNTFGFLQIFKFSKFQIDIFFIYPPPNWVEKINIFENQHFWKFEFGISGILKKSRPASWVEKISISKKKRLISKKWIWKKRPS